jgi:hypothetical protein
LACLSKKGIANFLNMPFASFRHGTLKKISRMA